jgi:hypothetical protein
MYSILYYSNGAGFPLKSLLEMLRDQEICNFYGIQRFISFNKTQSYHDILNRKHTPMPFFSITHSNVIFPSIPRSQEILFNRFSNRHFVSIYLFLCMLKDPPISSDLMSLIINEEYKLRNTPKYNFLHSTVTSS